MLRHRRQDATGRWRIGPGSAEAGVDGELEGAPLEEDAPGVTGVAEAHFRARAGCDVHLLALEVGHRRLEVLDLERNGVHATAETLDELGRRTVADRLADLNGVVARPGHTAAAPDARFGRLAVLQHGEPHQGGQVPDGEVVVGHHRRGVEQPPHVVAPPAAGPAHRNLTVRPSPGARCR